MWIFKISFSRIKKDIFSRTKCGLFEINFLGIYLNFGRMLLWVIEYQMLVFNAFLKDAIRIFLQVPIMDFSCPVF